MELPLSTWIVVVVVILLTFVWKLGVVVWIRPKRLERSLRQQGIDGTRYRLVIGDLRETSRMRREAQASAMEYFSNDIVPHLEPFLHQSIQRYGKQCFYTWMGTTPALNVLDGKLVMEVLARVYEFQKPEIAGIGDRLLSGVVMYEGEKWAKHRKLLNPAFHLERFKNVVEVSSAICEEMMSNWEMLLSQDGLCEIDILPYIDYVMGNIISRAVFGRNYEDSGKRIFMLQKEQIDNTFKVFKLSFIPGWRFLPTRLNRRITMVDIQIKALLKGIIDSKMKVIEEGEADSDDLLGLLLNSNYREKGMSIEEVIAECKSFYLAAKETIATLIIWTLILLSQHQDWQARAREEIIQVFGDKEIHFDGLSRLKIVNMILHETLRLYPPATYTVRTNNKATRLGAYHLPPGVLIYLPIVHIHHDQQLWGQDAQVFRPERFSQGVSKASMGRSPLPFLPFISGPRTCMGQNLALLKSKAILATIIRRFSIELSPSYKHAPSALLTIRPKYGVPVILRKV